LDCGDRLLYNIGVPLPERRGHDTNYLGEQTMANIILHQIQGIAVGLDKKDGYLNVTKLCIAYNLQKNATKKPGNWLRTQRAKDYISYLATVSQKRETELVIVKQGGSPDEQGTWIHPDLAIPFGTWLSVEFEYAVSRWIQEWHKTKDLQKFPERLTGVVSKDPALAAVEFIGAAIDVALSHIEPGLRAGNKIEAICEMFPEYRKALEPHKPKLLLESPLLTPTQLGELMDPPLSARAVNKLLCNRNLQKSTGEKNPAYALIGSGNEFGKVIADTAKGHGKTVQHVRWYESVMDLLNDPAHRQPT
jgi:KilA-N domain